MLLESLNIPLRERSNAVLFKLQNLLILKQPVWKTPAKFLSIEKTKQNKTNYRNKQIDIQDLFWFFNIL